MSLFLQDQRTAKILRIPTLDIKVKSKLAEVHNDLDGGDDNETEDDST